jgi:hypothetical protein
MEKLERDFTKYPDDDNGSVLWGLKCHGDVHETARDIEFCLDFEAEAAALQCGAYLFQNCYKIELEPPLEDNPDSPWTVLAIPFMRADYHEICEVESHLAEIAAHFGGVLSGWGCLAQSTS